MPVSITEMDRTFSEALPIIDPNSQVLVDGIVEPKPEPLAEEQTS